MNDGPAGAGRRRGASSVRGGVGAPATLAAVVAVCLLAGPAVAQEPALDTASLGSGPYAEMAMVYERGFLFIRVDVLSLRIRYGDPTAARLRQIGESDLPEPTRRDSAARVAAEATDAFARIRFLRGVTREQFLEATRENLERASEEGFVDPQSASRIAEDLPGWFAFLRDRDILEGDRLLYRIRGDTLRTLFIGGDGGALLDQTDVGPERRRAVLGGYLAPGTDFREGLLDSLLR